jgi:hypothetical protein
MEVTDFLGVPSVLGLLRVWRRKVRLHGQHLVLLDLQTVRTLQLRLGRLQVAAQHIVVASACKGRLEDSVAWAYTHLLRLTSEGLAM